MLYRFLILAALFCFFVFLQGAFLPHIRILGATPNLVLVLVCLLAFFSSPGSRQGRGLISGAEAYNIALIIFVGFLSDFFSNAFFGASAISLLAVYFFIKEAVRFLNDIHKKHSIIYFLPLFIISILIFEFLFKLFFWISNHSLPLYFGGFSIIIGMLYSLAPALIGFYIFKIAAFETHDF